MQFFGRYLILSLFLLLFLAGAVSGQTIFSVRCTGVSDTAAFTQLITAIGSNPGTIRLPYRGSSGCVVNNLSIPANVTLDNSDGSTLSINNGQTLTVAGPIVAPAKPLFTGAGVVSFAGNTSVSAWLPAWMGIKCDSTDEAAKWNAYASALGTTAARFVLPPSQAAGPRCGIGSATFQSNLNFDFTAGGSMIGFNGAHITILGSILAVPTQTIFYNLDASAGRGSILVNNQERLSAQWFSGVCDGGDDSTAFNNVLSLVNGSGNHTLVLQCALTTSNNNTVGANTTLEISGAGNWVNNVGTITINGPLHILKPYASAFGALNVVVSGQRSPITVNGINDISAGGSSTAVGVVNVKNYGAIADGNSHPITNADVLAHAAGTVSPWIGSYSVGVDEIDWVAAQEAEYAAFGQFGHGTNATLNRPLYFPAGGYRFNKTLQILNVQGGQIYGDGRIATSLNIAAANQSVVKMNGFSYSTVSRMQFNGAGTNAGTFPIVDADWDGVQAAGFQAVTFYDCLFQGNSVNSQIGLRVGVTGNQGSEFTYIDCHWTGFTVAGVRLSNFNALQHTFIGGNFQSNLKYGIWIQGGTVNLLSVGFQTTLKTQIDNLGADLAIFTVAGGDTSTIKGCRNETGVLVRSTSGHRVIIEGNNVDPFVAQFQSIHAYTVGQLVTGIIGGNGDGRVYIVTKAGTSAAGEPVWANTLSRDEETLSTTSGSNTVSLLTNQVSGSDQGGMMTIAGAGPSGGDLIGFIKVINSSTIQLFLDGGFVTPVNASATFTNTARGTWGPVTASGTVNFAPYEFGVIDFGLGAIRDNNLQWGRVEIASGNQVNEITIENNAFFRSFPVSADLHGGPTNNMQIRNNQKYLGYGGAQITGAGSQDLAPDFNNGGLTKYATKPTDDFGNHAIVFNPGGTGGLNAGTVGIAPGNADGSVAANNSLSVIGSLTSQLDNTFDWGLSNALRPRNLYVAGPSITPGSGTGITLNSSGNLNRLIYKITVTNAALSAAAHTADVTIGTLPAKTRLVGIIADVTQTFSGGGETVATMTCGKSAGGNQYLVSFDVFTGVITRGLADGDLGTSINRASAVQGGDLPSFSGTTAIQCRLSTTTNNTSSLVQGSVTFYLQTELMP